MDQKLYNSYVKILKNELVPALGCTEPIAIAYAAAKAHEVLGQMPEKIELCCSGNIIKNVKGVKVACEVFGRKGKLRLFFHVSFVSFVQSTNLMKNTGSEE